MSKELQKCTYTRKVIIEFTEYVYECNLEQYCRKLCKAHYELWSSKDYNVEPYKHSSKEKFYKSIKPLEIKGESNE